MRHSLKTTQTAKATPQSGQQSRTEAADALPPALLKAPVTASGETSTTTRIREGAALDEQEPAPGTAIGNGMTANGCAVNGSTEREPRCTGRTSSSPDSVVSIEQNTGTAERAHVEGLGHTYSVYVDDNFSLPPDDARYKLGDFATLEEAVAACKGMVDSFLKAEVPSDITAAERYEVYTHFGPDPFIATDDPGVGHPPFSAWGYAKERCQEG